MMSRVNITDTETSLSKIGKDIIRPTEGYVRWLREELNSGRWIADPEQPCLLYKVYKDVTRIPLDGDIPLQLGKDYEASWQSLPRVSRASQEQKLAWLLYYTHGLTRVLRPEAGRSSPLHKVSEQPTSYPKHIVGPVAHSSPFLGRPIPSGGSLHPVEIYLALGANWQFQAGIYHYDSAHHVLELLRAGDFLMGITACFPKENHSSPSSAVIFTTVCLQKNHQKYTNLSYLLQTLDTGIALEQLHFVAQHFEMPSTLCLRFLDYPLHHLLGLNPREELIYTALLLPISQGVASTVEKANTRDARDVEAQQIADLPSLAVPHVQPFLPHHQSSLLQQLYAASLLDTLPNNHDIPAQREEENIGNKELLLPNASLPHTQDMAQLLLRRHTSSQAIDTKELSITQLSTILASLKHMDSSLWQLCDCQVYCVVSRVSPLVPGVYRYAKERHALVSLQTESLGSLLMRLSTGLNIQPHLPPLNLFFCGNHQQALVHYGERGLRMLGIEIGRALQCISLSAAVYNLGTHIHLSYAVEGTRKRLLHLPTEAYLPLASMMVGYKKSAQENLFETVWY